MGAYLVREVEEMNQFRQVSFAQVTVYLVHPLIWFIIYFMIFSKKSDDKYIINIS